MWWQRRYEFLVVLLLIFHGTIFSQQQTPRIGQISPHLTAASERLPVKKILNFGYVNDAGFNHTVQFDFVHSVPLTSATGTKIIPSNLAVTNLPLFCKKEFQFERSTSIPLRVRLGSLEYVNKMEGK